MFLQYAVRKYVFLKIAVISYIILYKDPSKTLIYDIHLRMEMRSIDDNVIWNVYG